MQEGEGMDECYFEIHGLFRKDIKHVFICLKEKYYFCIRKKRRKMWHSCMNLYWNSLIPVWFYSCFSPLAFKQDDDIDVWYDLISFL